MSTSVFAKLRNGSWTTCNAARVVSIASPLPTRIKYVIFVSTGLHLPYNVFVTHAVITAPELIPNHILYINNIQVKKQNKTHTLKGRTCLQIIRSMFWSLNELKWMSSCFETGYPINSLPPFWGHMVQSQIPVILPRWLSPRPRGSQRAYVSFSSCSLFSMMVWRMLEVTSPLHDPTAIIPHAKAVTPAT